MAKTFTAPFAQTQKTGFALTNTAIGTPASNTPTNTVLIATVGSDGALLTKVSAIPLATVSSATTLLLYIRKNSDGSTIRNQIGNALMPAYTWSANTITPLTTFTEITPDTPIRLESLDEVHVGIAAAITAPGIQFKAEWTNF